MVRLFILMFFIVSVSACDSGKKNESGSQMEMERERQDRPELSSDDHMGDDNEGSYHEDSQGEAGEAQPGTAPSGTGGSGDHDGGTGHGSGYTGAGTRPPQTDTAGTSKTAEKPINDNNQ